MSPFVYTSLPTRVVFGRGALDQLGAEVNRLGLRRALVLTTPNQRALGEDVVSRLTGNAAGLFDQAVMHVPIETVAVARELAVNLRADGCVAIGGGTAVGLGKAIALGFEAGTFPIVAIPTTFSGSEMTPIHGTTAAGKKTTGRDPRVLPRVVLYDTQLIMALPVRMAAASGMNAIAHCVEALYAEDANPITSLMAEEGIRALGVALPRVAHFPEDEDARAEALYGAWLGGTCLGAVGMGLHHKLCHTLGGRYNLPHAETHAILLPQVVAYNREAAPEAIRRITRALGGDGDAAQGLYDLAVAAGIPMALKDLAAAAGRRDPSSRLTADGLEEVARLATQNATPNPRPLDLGAVRQLLEDAWEGRRPRARP